MKKYYCITLVLFLALFLASCSKKDYMNVIPADATFVASINLEEIAEKADLKNASVVNLMKGYVGLVASGDEKEKVKMVMDDPSLMGIDFSEPAYVFETIDHCWGVVFNVKDNEHLEETFKVLSKQQIASKPTEKDGMRWTSLLGDINVAYDSQRLLILFSQEDGVTPALLKRQMTVLMGQESDLSFAETDQMQKLEQTDGPIAIYSRMAALPQDMAQSLAGMLPKGVRSHDVEVCFSANFGDGEAVLKATMFAENEHVQHLFEEADAHMRKIQGDFLGAASDRFFAWLSMGCEGEWLLNMLKQNEQVKQALFMLERGIDIEQMLRSIDGDVTLMLPQEPATEGVTKNDFIALAHVKDTNFLSDVSNWQRTASDYGITLCNTGKNEYLMRSQDMQLQWGVDDATLYFATPDAYAQRAFSSTGNTLVAYKDEIQSSQFFALLNLQAMDNPTLIPFDAIVLKSEKSGEVELRLVGKDKHRNILSQALDMLTNIFK